MTDRQTLSDTELQAIIRAEIANCDSETSSSLSSQRAENLRYYLGEPLGTEIEGRSSVVSTSVADTIEWILPILIRIFCSGEKVVEFEPQGPEDIKAAEQATDYVDFIWNRDNPGFHNLYVWFKDALLSKNGFVKIYYETREETKRERLSGLDDEAFAKAVADKNVEVSEHTERQEFIQPPAIEGQPIPEPVPITVHDVVLTRTLQVGRVCVDPIPPEEFIISKDAHSIEDARFVGHKRKRTLSDLIKSGFDKATVNALSEDDDAKTSPESLARDTVEDSGSSDPNPLNNAMREVWVTEGYAKVDVDGDGIAEMRQVTVAGSGYTILANDAWDSPRPLVSLTPIIMPHRFFGLCPADVGKEIQRITTALQRQFLDNVYLNNNAREEVVESAIVDPSELLTSTPGAKIRVRQANSIRPLPPANVAPQILEALNYFDQVRENRTGVSPRTQGLGADALHETAQGERMLMTAAMSKIELIARVFAETGVKDAFRLILRLVCQYQDKPRTIRLRNDWVAMDPSSWNADMDMTVSVGMGTGDKDQQLQHAVMLGQMQEKAAAFNMVTPENLMNTAELAVSAMGQKGVQRFFTMPDPNAPPKPDPAMAKVQQEGQFKAQQLQMDQQQQQFDMQAEIQEMQQKFELEMQQLRAEMDLKRQQIGAELMLKREEMAQRPHIEGIKAQAAVSNGVHVGGDPG